MIEFKKVINKILPYNREQYFDFLDDDCDSQSYWYAVSFQIKSRDERQVDIKNVDVFESLFKNLILKLDNNSCWIVNHDDKDLKWFPNDEDNLTSLRTLFKQNIVPNTFIGALIFTKDDLLKFAKDLISYPYTVFNKEGLLYKNLDISHSELQFIIKTTGHLTIDLLSTDKELLRKVINDNSSSYFNIKEYRGTSLWV
jgi:hypothetical protein